MAYTTLSVAYVNGDVFSAGDINNTNTVANALSNGTNQALIAAKGDILTGSATANALAKTTVGSNNTVLYANSAAASGGGVSWGLVTDAMIDASAGIVDTKLATITTANKVANSATTATSANTASAIVARDASGNFTATTITATTIVCTSAYTRGTVSGFTPTSAKVHISSSAPSSPAAGDIWFQI